MFGWGQTKRELKEYRTRCQRLGAEVDELSGELAGRNLEIQDLREALRSEKQSTDFVLAKLEAANTKLDETRNQLRQAEAGISERDAFLETAYRDIAGLKRQLAGAQKNDTRDPKTGRYTKVKTDV